MRKNKLIAALLAISMLASSLAACNQDILDVPDGNINGDDPVIEEPITEAPVIEEPIEEEPVEEEPIEEEPVEEEPVEEEPVEEEPVEEEPVEEEPVEEEPVEEEPVEEEPVEEELVEEEPVIDVPVEEEPVIEVPEVEYIDNFEPIEEYENVENPEDYITPFEDILYLRENLPKMDGSTSLILLEMGLKAKLYGISFTEALARVEHTTTYGSFERLLNKEVDIIFSTPLSDEQYDQAAQAGMDLELVPIASESFVFIVNADNPVDSLTQQQIKDIYSGKITNWKEVGGNDIEIVAFQRNRTSGSQNYMIQFMGDVNLMNAPYELVPDAMDSLVEAVKSYDNSENAIGYSVYAYAADMYGLGDSLKFIKVDGVEPTKETMAAKEYPLVNFNYAIYDKNSATEAVLKTAEWISSTDGQTAIAEAGYVPYANIQREYLELTGTGKPKPQDYKEPVVKYIALSASENEHGFVFSSGSTINAYTYIDDLYQTTTTEWQISGLVDDDLEAEINKKLSELEVKYSTMLPKANKYIETLVKLSNHTFNKTSRIYQGGYYFEPRKDVEVSVKNGYMCILAGVFYIDGADRRWCYSAEAVYYDLIKGKEISFTDLFYEGIDVDEAIFDLLTDKPLGSYSQGFFLPAVYFTDISKITSTEYFAMGFDKIYFNYDNPFFCVGEMFEISPDNGYLCVEEPNSMEGIFDVDIFNRMSFASTHSYPIYEYVNVGENYTIRVKMLDENGEYGERNKKINDAVRQYISETYSVDKVTEDLINRGWTMEEIKEWHELEFFYSENSLGMAGYSDAFVIMTNESEIDIMFDGKTGEVIEFFDLLIEGWQDHIKIAKADELSWSGYKKHTPEETSDIDKNIIPANAKFISFTDSAIRYGMPNNGKAYLPLVFVCADSGLEIVVYVDSDYVKGFTD